MTSELGLLLSAVITASLLGSLHCVGMCGPLALWATSSTDEAQSRGGFALANGLYHGGRGLTYALAGFIAGGLGSLANVAGSTMGIQLLAAQIVGIAMIIAGGFQLYRMVRLKTTSNLSVNASAPSVSLITRMLVAIRPYLFRLPTELRGLTAGLLTPLLPCGWLYLFALVAASSGSMAWGGLVMLAFWLGTVPALTALMVGTRKLAASTREYVPIGAAVVLILAGFTTWSGRGFANVTAFEDLVAPPTTQIEPETGVQQISNQLLKTELPCCHSSASATPQHSD